MASSLEELVAEGRRILVFGAGGGGDALGALALYSKIRGMGGEALLGSVVWERWRIDPTPGPIPVESLVNARRVGWSLAVVGGETEAVREGYRVRPQIARIAGRLGVEALFIDLSKGSEGVREALDSAVEEFGVEALIALDTGGDILAIGCEDDLWSPLADAVSISGLSGSRAAEKLVAVLAPGADGELPASQVLEYVSYMASKGGLVGTYGISRREYEAMKSVEDSVESEASKIPLRAFEGYSGQARIRGGIRRADVTPVSTAIFLLEAGTVYSESGMGREVEGTSSIWEARERLNRRCVYTELDLELDLDRIRREGLASRASIDEIRREGRRRLLLEGCRPFKCSRRPPSPPHRL